VLATWEAGSRSCCPARLHTASRAPRQDKLTAKAPFKQYASLPGLKVTWGSPTDYSTYPEGPFDVVYDNNGKDLESCKPLIDASKVGGTPVMPSSLESLHVPMGSFRRLECLCRCCCSASLSCCKRATWPAPGGRRGSPAARGCSVAGRGCCGRLLTRDRRARAAAAPAPAGHGEALCVRQLCGRVQGQLHRANAR
jgi:hypothetical protein